MKASRQRAVVTQLRRICLRLESSYVCSVALQAITKVSGSTLRKSMQPLVAGMHLSSCRTYHRYAIIDIIAARPVEDLARVRVEPAPRQVVLHER